MVDHEHLHEQLERLGASACPCCGVDDWAYFEENALPLMVTSPGIPDEHGNLRVNVAGAGDFRALLWVCRRCGFIRLMRPELIDPA